VPSDQVHQRTLVFNGIAVPLSHARLAGDHEHVIGDISDAGSSCCESSICRNFDAWLHDDLVDVDATPSLDKTEDTSRRL